MIYLTGFHAIEERIRAGLAKGTASGGALLVAKTGPRGGKVVALAVGAGVPVRRTGSHELDRLAPDNRGVALMVEDAAGGGILSLEGFLGALEPGEDALVVILDEITDPHNYGAILRSCDQFGASLVLGRNRRSAKHADVIAKTSAGASAWVPALETANLPRAVQDLKAAGFWVYGADARGEPLSGGALRGRLALVLGGEAGLSRLLRESCDKLLAIPTRGRLDSLNVSVAAGIFLYEASRRPAGRPLKRGR